MSPMSDQPVTLAVLAQFHREIILPDVQRIVGEAIAGSERRMQANFDAIFHKLDKLETEYELLKVGLARVEERLDRMDARLDQVDARLDRMDARFDQVDQRLDRIEGRLHGLESQYQDLVAGLHRLEERLARVERNVDELVAAREKEPLRDEVANLRARVDSLQADVRILEKRLDK